MLRCSPLQSILNYATFEYCKRILIWIGVPWMQDNSLYILSQRKNIQGEGGRRALGSGIYCLDGRPLLGNASMTHGRTVWESGRPSRQEMPLPSAPHRPRPYGA